MVFGGDGTVHEIVNGIAGREGVELAVVPRGTGRDFVRTHGIPKRLADALRIAQEGEARFDLGRATYRVGTRRDGVVRECRQRRDERRHRGEGERHDEGPRRKTSYLIALGAVFARWKNVELDVKVDGEARSGLMEDVIVGIGRYQAGGMMTTPDAEPDDGLFDVLLIKDATKPEVIRAAADLQGNLPPAKAEVLRGRVVEVETPDPLPVQLDGEQPGTSPVRFEIEPAAIRLRVPPS